MSCQSGNIKKGAPKHQNSFAFKHNPKSRKTDRILALPNEGLCPRCHEQIEWRKKYRKYKPLTAPATCNNCKQKTVLAAYHTICKSCCTTTSPSLKRICAKCTGEIKTNEGENINDDTVMMHEETSYRGPLKERERRSLLRKQAKAAAAAASAE